METFGRKLFLRQQWCWQDHKIVFFFPYLRILESVSVSPQQKKPECGNQRQCHNVASLLLRIYTSRAMQGLKIVWAHVFFLEWWEKCNLLLFKIFTRGFLTAGWKRWSPLQLQKATDSQVLADPQDTSVDLQIVWDDVKSLIERFPDWAPSITLAAFTLCTKKTNSYGSVITGGESAILYFGQNVSF